MAMIMPVMVVPMLVAVPTGRVMVVPMVVMRRRGVRMMDHGRKTPVRVLVPDLMYFPAAGQAGGKGGIDFLAHGRPGSC